MLLIFQKHQLNSSPESKIASLSLFTPPVRGKLKCAQLFHSYFLLEQCQEDVSPCYQTLHFKKLPFTVNGLKE